MSVRFNMTRDINGFNGFGLPFTTDGFATSLAANAAQSVTVPYDYPNWIAVFSYTPGANVWVDGITTAAVPSTSFASTTAQLNPSARFVHAGETLSFITADSTTPWVCVDFYIAPPFGN